MAKQASTTPLEGWFAGRLPDDGFPGPPSVTTDREEILVVGTLAEPAYPDGADDAAKAAARPPRMQRLRRETPEQRLRTADQAGATTGRQAACGARRGHGETASPRVGLPG